MAADVRCFVVSGRAPLQQWRLPPPPRLLMFLALSLGVSVPRGSLASSAESVTQARRREDNSVHKGLLLLQTGQGTQRAQTGTDSGLILVAGGTTVRTAASSLSPWGVSRRGVSSHDHHPSETGPEMESKGGISELFMTLERSNFFCTPPPGNSSAAVNGTVVGVNGTVVVVDACVLGISKYGWAVVLTALSMMVLLMCIPLVLSISRRRPPGTSMCPALCGTKPQRPQPHLAFVY